MKIKSTIRWMWSTVCSSLRGWLVDFKKVGVVVVAQKNGVLYLTLGTHWIQGAMRVSCPHELELEYARRMMGWMLFESDPALIVQLGLGSGALAKFCLLHFPRAKVEVVEIDEQVIHACQRCFFLPQPSQRFNLVLGDALSYVLDLESHGRASVLLVDVYDADSDGPAVGSTQFYQGCFDCLSPGGWICVNLFGDHRDFTRHHGDMSRIFSGALTLGTLGVGNVIVMARKGPVGLDMSRLTESALAVSEATGMDTTSWVEDLWSQQSSKI